MSTRVPEVKVAPAQPPRPVEGPGPPTGTPARNLWIVAVIVALVVGAAGGYFLRWGTEPTKIVTRTVTKTVAPPAYATAGLYTVRVEGISAPKFTNWRCTYSGPTEFQAGTTLRFAFSGRNWTFSVSRLMPGTTWEQFASGSSWIDFVLRNPSDRPIVWASDPGSSLEVPRLREGLYGIMCSGAMTPFPVAIVRVAPS